MAGYYRALEKAGIPVRIPDLSWRLYDSGRCTVEELVQKNPDMTAVFVTNYEMTMGAMIGVNELGIRIPGTAFCDWF